MTKSERNPNDEARESQRDSATKQPDRSGSSYVVLIQGCEQRATLGHLGECASTPKELCH